MSTVQASGPLSQPTTFLENASRNPGRPQPTLWGENPRQSATHFWLGAETVKVRRGDVVGFLPGRPVLPASAQVGAFAAVFAHDPFGALAADADAAVAQFQPHPQRAVGGGELVLAADLIDQPPQLVSSRARRDGSRRALRES